MAISITRDETIRTIEIYDPGVGFTEEAAKAVAAKELESPDKWDCLDCTYIRYDKVEVRFRLQ